MDEDTDSANWVLVDEIDCAEEGVKINPRVTSVPATPDSDQESDGSIGVISDHPTDSYSEEETEVLKKNYDTTKIMPIIKIDTEFETDVTEEEIEIQDQITENEELLETNPVEDNIQDMSTNRQTNDDGESSTSEPSSKQWMLADEKSKLELDVSKKTFFLDCSQEPILEVSANDTDVDTESTNSSQECQAIVKKEDPPVTNISNRDQAREREVHLNRISIGFLFSMLILTSSHLIIQYLDYNEDGLHAPSPSTSFLDSIANNEKARPIVNFCINKQKAKGIEYSDHAVEKCVIKRLKKKNREDTMKKTEIYLQMKERILELREKELAEKEREILKKWRKRMYKTDDVEEERNKKKYDKKHKEDKEDKTSKELNQKLKRNLDHEEKSRENEEDISSEKVERTWKTDEIKGKIKTFRKRGSWVFEKVKEATNWNHKMHSEDDFISNKKFKKVGKDKEETLKHIKKEVIDLQKDKSKQYKDLKGDKKEDPNEEWYIKYNPLKNTIELINITTLPQQDFMLIKNGNKTINGQWYFSLYGSARSNIRNKEKAAEWYFRRGNFREHKRDKAKWYFDYMSARDNTRYFY